MPSSRIWRPLPSSRTSSSPPPARCSSCGSASSSPSSASVTAFRSSYSPASSPRLPAQLPQLWAQFSDGRRGQHPDLFRRPHRYRPRGHRRGRIHHRSRAFGAGDLRQTGPRQQSLRRRLHLPPAPPQPGRRHPDHLRPVHPHRAATVANFFINNPNVTLATFASHIVSFLNPSGWGYGISYFFLVFLFTYFYTAVTFDPKQISENLQKSGAFIPGVRPGDSTMQYLARVVTRITLVGALFLGTIAVLPLIMQGFTGGTSFAIGGTALLIVVSVVLDLVKKVDAQIAMREY